MELAERNRISFQEAQRLLLSAAAPNVADDIVRRQRVRGHCGLIRPLFDLHGEELARWTRRRLKRLAERLLLHDFPMVVNVPVDSLPSSARTDELRTDVHAARVARDLRAEWAEGNVARLRSIATPSQRAIVDVWLEFERLGEQPTHARVAAALGIDPATVRNQWHKARARTRAARMDHSITHKESHL